MTSRFLGGTLAHSGGSGRLSRIRFNWAGWCLVCAALTGALGCRAHVSLSLPPPSAPLAEREAAYLELRPVRVNETIMMGGPYGATSFDQELVLANRSRIYYPEDILSVVPRNSKSAELVERSLSSRATASACTLGGLAAMVVFAALLFAKLDSSSSSSLSTTGLAVTGLGAVGLSMTGYFFAKSAHERAVEAYDHYDDDLQDALSICAGPRCGNPVVRDASESSVPSPKPSVMRSKR
jgi:hypothetical protein